MNNAQSPEDLPKLFVEYWNQPRPDLMAALFEEDADFINVVGLWWNNRQDIFKAHDYGLKMIFKNSVLSIIKLKTKMLSQKSARVWRAPSRPPVIKPCARQSAFIAPALVPLTPSKLKRPSSSKASSTPQVNAPCAPPPCRARLMVRAGVVMGVIGGR